MKSMLNVFPFGGKGLEEIESDSTRRGLLLALGSGINQLATCQASVLTSVPSLQSFHHLLSFLK